MNQVKPVAWSIRSAIEKVQAAGYNSAEDLPREINDEIRGLIVNMKNVQQRVLDYAKEMNLE